MASDKKLQKFVQSIQKEIKPASDKNLRDFAKLLYGHAVPEDLNRYSPQGLAKLAKEAFAFMRTRKPGPAKVRTYNPSGTERLDMVTVIEMANDDMPFLVDSVMGLLGERGYTIELVLHPLITSKRSAKGKIERVTPEGNPAEDPSLSRDSFIHVHIERISSEKVRKELEKEILSVLHDVRTVVLDWRPMRTRVEGAVREYQETPPPIAVDELSEATEFLQFLIDNNFTFLGVREYDFKGSAAKGRLVPVEGTGLGILRNPDVKVLRRGRELVSYTPELREFLQKPAPLIITKANVRATVHRRTHMDYIGIKQFDGKGKLKGELRVVGMFTSVAYPRSPRFIPLLRRK
ncbi:MAG: NAD-glutamate dehydrogenase, partial [Hyphomicrobiales bacterium]